MRRRALAHLDDVADAIVVCVVLGVESEYTGLRVDWRTMTLYLPR